MGNTWANRNMSCSVPFRTLCGCWSDYALDGSRGGPEAPAAQAVEWGRPHPLMRPSRNAPVVPQCDSSDTANSQKPRLQPLRLIHEIERLDLVRVRRVRPHVAALRLG